MRKGRDRRRNFARSTQDIATCMHRIRNSSSASNSSDQTRIEFEAAKTGNPYTTLPPPLRLGQRKQTIPADKGHENLVSEHVKGIKRKRNEDFRANSRQDTIPNRISHQRSQTLGDSIGSTPVHRLPDNSYRPRVDPSKEPDGSVLDDALMKQARRLAPAAKSDTTRTDYFRLKALGIDPHTPAVPVTRKHPRVQTEIAGSSKRTKISRPDPPTSRIARVRPVSKSDSILAEDQAPTTATDEDEALFAQIRSVREALAESEHWFQSERQGIERDMTPQQTTASPPEPLPESESPAQRRLREIKEKGPTPSRTELRLRAMGDKALLPHGFWDGEGMGTSLMKGKERGRRWVVPGDTMNHGEQYTPNGPMGFAAMANVSGTRTEGVQRQTAVASKTGASMEDAIEL